MNINKLTFQSSEYPEVLKNIPSPPLELYVIGAPLQTLLLRPRITIVGSRKVSAYGKAVTTQFATECSRAGIVVISGLALGVDALAHRGALEGGSPTIAVLPCGIDTVYPSSHAQLARTILEQGGALVSEYPPGSTPYKINFIARNRIASGLGQGLLITEAAVNSGTLHTARFALEQGRDVMAVPGNITSPTSAGTNNLIKCGATPVTSPADVLHILGVSTAATAAAPAKSDNPHEQCLLDLLQCGESDGTLLLAKSNLDVQIFNQSLTMLEIRGIIRPLGNNQWSL